MMCVLLGIPQSSSLSASGHKEITDSHWTVSGGDTVQSCGQSGRKTQGLRTPEPAPWTAVTTLRPKGLGREWLLGPRERAVRSWDLKLRHMATHSNPHTREWERGVNA